MGARTGYSPGTFCWANLATSDPAGAKAFYAGLFGWDIEGGPEAAMARLDGASVASIVGVTGHPPAWSNYVRTDDAEATVARARELGAAVIEEPFAVGQAGRLALFANPQGARLALWEPQLHPGPEVVNVPGAMTWNDLQTGDVAAASDFYSELFAWTVAEVPESGGRYDRCRSPAARSSPSATRRARPCRSSRGSSTPSRDDSFHYPTTAPVAESARSARRGGPGPPTNGWRSRARRAARPP